MEPIYKNILPEIFNDGLKIHVVNPIEIFAAKGNALISRAAARDLYDWGNMIEADLFRDNIDIFRKCFIFYATISADSVNREFDTKAIDSLTFSKIKRDLFPVISKKDNFQLEERKQKAKEYISNLMQLTMDEIEYINQFIEKNYRPELLFKDQEIIERIARHPMALWKCR